MQFVLVIGHRGLNANGPAIKGGCVTRHVLTEASGRELQAESRYFSQKVVTSLTLTELKASVMGCKEGMARVFAVMVQILLSITRVANFDKWPKSCLGCRKQVNWHWRSVAVQTNSEP